MSENTVKPLLSVILPVYNTEKYLRQCIESILNQTFRYIEVIAVDDGSTDNSGSILREYSRKDGRFRVYRNKKNRGVSSSLNLAIRHCKTPLIVRMDSDDIMLSCRIEKQYNCLQAHPDYVLLGGQISYINDKNEITGASRFPLHDYEIKNKLFYFQTVADSTLLFNRQLIPAGVFCFDDKLVVAEGLDLYLRLLNYGRYANLEDTLVLLRDRPDSLSKNIKRNFKVISGVRTRAIKQYGVKAPLPAGIVSLLQHIAVMLLPFSLVMRLVRYMKKILNIGMYCS